MSKKEFRIPREVAERWGTSEEFVLSLIRSGDLEASNISRVSSRARWIISEEAEERYLSARSNQQKAGSKPKSKRQKPKREYV